jgi:hypothetical protein
VSDPAAAARAVVTGAGSIRGATAQRLALDQGYSAGK